MRVAIYWVVSWRCGGDCQCGNRNFVVRCRFGRNNSPSVTEIANCYSCMCTPSSFHPSYVLNDVIQVYRGSDLYAAFVSVRLVLVFSV